MTWYREIDCGAEPGDIGLDANQRQKFAFNVSIIKGHSTTLVADILSILETAGVGTRAVNIFIGAKSNIPTGDGPYLSLAETGGMRPERTQNSVAVPAYQRPSLQIVGRARTYEAARAMAYAAYYALVGVRNTNIN